MGKALTPFEKRERYEASLNSNAQPQQEQTQPQAEGKPTRRRGNFNGTTSKLSVSRNPEGYRLYWLNDYPGRVTQALDGGYEFCTPEEVGEEGNPLNTDDNTKVVRIVGVDESGQPVKAYLMKLRLEWYQEDELERSKRPEAVEAIIREGKNPNGGSSDKFYIPRGDGIKIR